MMCSSEIAEHAEVPKVAKATKPPGAGQGGTKPMPNWKLHMWRV